MNNGINTTKKRICTVILPVYNSQRYLNRTISSVLQQTLEDFELLAIDDGSVDDSVALLQRWGAKGQPCACNLQSCQSGSGRSAQSGHCPGPRTVYCLFGQ